MSFIVYDIIFLVIFALFATVFLYKRRRNLQRHGWMFLYHTKLGIKVMDKLATRYKRILKPLQYVVVTVGYILLIGMVWLLITTVYEYVTSPFLAKALRIPPLLPLFPYFSQIFKVESLFPPFYFTYFILSIGIVAIGHEFAHGLFARLNKVRIKSTGFAFFGPFFGAFVEQDDRDMNRIKKFPQLAILAAGVFANIIMSVIFGLILWGFFAASFAPAGVAFNTYTIGVVNVSGITAVDNATITSFAVLAALSPMFNDSLVHLTTSDGSFFVPGNSLKTAISEQVPALTAYEDTPALRARLAGPIVSFDGVPTPTIQTLRDAIQSHRPGDTVTIVTVQDDQRISQTVTLDERNGKAYLGVGVNMPSQNGFRGVVSSFLINIKDPFTYYEPVWGGDFAWFVYYLLWWIWMINLLVALFNMLPLGILDGGRFFYLTIWGITGKERWGKRAFAAASWFFIALLGLMMVRWFIAVF